SEDVVRLGPGGETGRVRLLVDLGRFCLGGGSQLFGLGDETLDLAGGFLPGVGDDPVGFELRRLDETLRLGHDGFDLGAGVVRARSIGWHAHTHTHTSARGPPYLQRDCADLRVVTGYQGVVFQIAGSMSPVPTSANSAAASVSSSIAFSSSPAS